MSTFDWVVLAWLALLTLRSVAGQASIDRLRTAMLESGLWSEPGSSEKKRPCPPTYKPPFHRENPDENPFLKAGIDAVKEAKKQQEDKAHG